MAAPAVERPAARQSSGRRETTGRGGAGSPEPAVGRAASTGRRRRGDGDGGLVVDGGVEGSAGGDGDWGRCLPAVLGSAPWRRGQGRRGGGGAVEVGLAPAASERQQGGEATRGAGSGGGEEATEPERSPTAWPWRRERWTAAARIPTGEGGRRTASSGARGTTERRKAAAARAVKRRGRRPEVGVKEHSLLAAGLEGSGETARGL